MKLPLSNLAGANFRDQLSGIAGAMLALALTGAVCSLAFGSPGQFNLLVAPMGATAVLLFMVPASPLAQPWPILFGNTVSAVIGVAVGNVIAEPVVASGVAVSLAIAAMIATRSLHPPGGAAALYAIVGGAGVKHAGFMYPFVPVAVNSLVLIGLGIVFHRIAGNNYPHRKAAAPANVHQTTDISAAERTGFTPADIDQAISDLHETLDIDRSDIETLLRLAEQRALQRAHGELTCARIMSRDVISLPSDRTVADARRLLIGRRLRILPVANADGTLEGIVGLRDLDSLEDSAPLPAVPAATAYPEDAAVSLLPKLTDGRNHGVIIVDHLNHIEGIVSQTDLLAALGSLLLSREMRRRAPPVPADNRSA